MNEGKTKLLYELSGPPFKQVKFIRCSCLPYFVIFFICSPTQKYVHPWSTKWQIISKWFAQICIQYLKIISKKKIDRKHASYICS